MNSERQLRFGRRPLLGGIGAGIAHMFLRPLLAEAQGMVPQRLLLVHRPCGSWPKQFFPTTPPGTGWGSTPLLDSFAALRNKMVILKGVDCPRTDMVNGDRHGMGIMTMLAGTMVVQPPGTSQSDLNDTNSKTITAGAPTFDQYVLDPVKGIKALTGTRFPSIQLAGTSRSAQSRQFTCLTTLSYGGPSRPLFPETRSQVAFNNILGQVMVGGGRPLDPAIIAKQQALGKSVFDFVLSDLARVKKLVPSAQQPKLEEHTEAIRQLEVRITSAPPAQLAGCVKPTLIPEPSVATPDATKDEVAHIAVATNMLAIIRCAFQCDVTRVASFTFADGNNGMRPHSYVPNPTFNIQGEHHGAVSHGGSSPDAIAAKVQTDKLYGDLTAAALAEMDKVPEGDPTGKTTLLDNTLTFYFSECSIGDDHNTKDMPILFFGGKFLKLNVGNYLAYTPSLYMNDVWTTILNAWGQPIMQFSDPKWCRSSGPQSAKGLILG
jgi:hypothetical protein